MLKKAQKYLQSKDKVKTVQFSVGGPSPADPTEARIVWLLWWNMIRIRLTLRKNQIKWLHIFLK